jgi:hypothetical membrane protein
MNRIGLTARLTLLIGAAVSPIFFITVFIQAAVRPGYTLQHVPLSLLSLGNGGWVQITNFVVCGILALFSTIGIRAALAHHRGGIAAPLFAGIYGLGLVLAGSFHPDPAAGFPLGMTEPSVPTWHNEVHNTAFLLVNLSLVVCCFVFTAVFRRDWQRGWAWYALASGVVGIVFVVGGIAISNFLGTTFGGVVIYSFLSIASAKLAVQTCAPQRASAPVNARG